MSEDQKQHSGEVHWFDAKKGYGFIIDDNTKKEYFVHYTSIIVEEGKFRSLEQNQKVTYEIGEGKKGPMAVNVRANG